MRDRVELLKSLEYTGEGVELGVAHGWYSEQILQHTNLARLYSIDPWSKPAGSDVLHLADVSLYLDTLRLLRPFAARSTVLRLYSHEAKVLFARESLDFIYIDSQHWRPEITRDIANYWPLVRPGGMLAGHDYGTCFPDVTDVVDEFAGREGLELHLTDCDQMAGEHVIRTWYVFKPDRV